MSQRHSNHSLVIHNDGMVSAVKVGTITSLAHALGSQVTAPQTGDPFNVGQVITRQQPSFSFGTHSLADVMDEVPLTGLEILSTTNPGVTAYAQRHDLAGTFGRAAANHLSLTAGQGLMVIDSISGQVGQEAVLTGTVHGLTPNGNDYPFTVAYNATLPTGVNNSDRYMVGKSQILGTTVDRIQSLTVNYNPQLIFSQDADTIWPTVVDIEKIAISVNIITEDPAWLNDTGRIAETGDYATHAGGTSNIYFLKVDTNGNPTNGGAFEDFTDIAHIEGQLNGLIHVSEHYNASGSGASQTSIEFVGIYDGTNAPIIWDTTAVYPL